MTVEHSPINTSDYNLLDSDTNEVLSSDDLGCSHEEFRAAIRESLECAQAEGYVRCRGRRVYAMPV